MANYRNHPIMSAVEILATVCDGARKRDSKGFNGRDAGFAADLINSSTVGLNGLKAAHKMLCKYTKQLSGLGIDYAALTLPQESAITPFSCTIEKDGIKCRFPYDEKIVALVKGVQGRRYDTQDKSWTINFSVFPNLYAKLKDLGMTLANESEILAAAEANARAKADRTAATAKLNGSRVEIRFAYNPEFVALVKSVGARWNPELKFWSIEVRQETLSNIQSLIKRLQLITDPTIYEALEAAKGKAEVNLEASMAKDADISVEGLGGSLLPFQKAGVKFMSDNKSTIMADEMGLGKTVQALAALEYNDAYPAIVICPASLALNWMKEAKKWLPKGRSVELFDHKKGIEGSPDLLILNYEKLKHLPESYHKKAIIIDEAHRVKNHKAQRTILAGMQAKGAEHRWLLTGTPIVNRPIELVSLLKILDKLADFGGWHKFVMRYCAPKNKRIGNKVFTDYSGASNMQELKLNLRKSCMIRREKVDVLPELPEKRSSVIPVEISNRSEYKKASQDLLSYIRAQAKAKADILETAENEGDAAVRKAEQAEVLVRINTLRQIAARGKLDMAGEWMHDFLGDGDGGCEKKLVVFTYHKDVLYAAKEMLDSMGVGSVTFCGDDSQEDREKAVSSFQEDPKTRVFLGTLSAGGEGITLTAASDVLFLEQGWKPSETQQAEDRCHRIGQKSSVTSYLLQATGTIEDWIFEMIESKKSVTDVNRSVLADVLERLKIESEQQPSKPKRR